MDKNKLISLMKYQSDLKSRLTDALPKKHLNRETTYKAFLNNELRIVSSQIEQAKLENTVK